MLKYHGTPITPKAQLDRMQGRNFCVSYARPDNLSHCLRIGQSVMFDNGAFSVKTRGEVFDLHGLYEWLDPILAHPHWAVLPDVIDGSVEEQRAMVATWPHRKEFGVPVWHLGLPLSYLIELCDQWGKVCLGSAGAYWDVLERDRKTMHYPIITSGDRLRPRSARSTSEVLADLMAKKAAKRRAQSSP